MTSGFGRHVIFGAGQLGQALAHELVERGNRVRVVSRSGRGAVPPGAELRRGDATDRASARELVAGAAAVYQVAQPPYTRWPEDFPPIQRGLIDAASYVDARLVVAENLYMYGRVTGTLTEDLPYAATTRKGSVRARMAEELMEAHERGEVRAASARASNFYGPGVRDSAFGERVFGPALAGKRVRVLGDLDAPHSVTYIGDFARALAVLGDRDEALGAAWHVPSAAPTQRDFVSLVFREAGTAAGVGRVPSPVVRLLGRFNPTMREVAEMLYEFEEPLVLDASKYAAAFGGEVTPLPEGVRNALAWYSRDRTGLVDARGTRTPRTLSGGPPRNR